MKEALRLQARNLGFDICRVTPAAPPAHSEEFLAWVREGFYGEMNWLERNQERRTDPEKVLPGAKSIIVLAMNYWQGQATRSAETSAEDPCVNSANKVARYAWGDDYHDLIEAKLKQLDAFLQSHGGTQKYYVDTGPILERDFAERAGVGWHGKSTMLISPEFGTWLFLAEILTTLSLPPDPPSPNRCGQCTRCIAACPTGAIIAPHKLDARRCISYLTIELKGSIPVEFRALIGDRIYGCDECLRACPWNRFAKKSNMAEFQAREALTTLSLREFLSLDDEQFRTLFRKSPIKRIKRRGFLRNVCVALGNTGSEEDLPALEKAAADPEELIAEHALWAIEEIKKRQPQGGGRSL